MNKKHILILLTVVLLFMLLMIYKGRKKAKLDELLNYEDYEGDNYSGQESYVGDKDFYKHDFGRQNAVAVKSSVYKVIEPAYKLRLETKDGKKILVKEGENIKYNKGAQLRIIDTTVDEPLVIHGQSFVRDTKGLFIRMDKVKKIRD